MLSADQLRNRLSRTPYLLIDCAAGDASLVDADGMRKALGDQAYFVMDALGAVRGLAKQSGGRVEFSLTDIAQIAGVDYFPAHYWMREGVIVASVRPASGAGRGRGPVFNFGDAVVAGIVGTLRRHNLSI